MRRDPPGNDDPFGAFEETPGVGRERKLHHGGHPVLRWNASCLTAKEQNDNLMFAKPERSTSSSRIDGIAATVNALARAMVAGPKKQSVYQTRGIRTISVEG